MIKTVNFGLISSKNIKDIQKKFKFREVYFNPEYILSVVNFEKNSEPWFFYVEDGADFCYYQFIKREIDIEVNNRKYFDAITPFDYGGFEYSDEKVLPCFFQKFENFCKQECIVSNFIRFNPFGKNTKVFKNYMDISFVQEHIYMDLKSDIIKSMSQRKRLDIKRGLEENFLFSAEDNLDNFYEVYVQTMSRINANQYFYFNQNSLKKLAKFTKIFSILHKKQTVMSVMVLEDTLRCYYFLSGVRDGFQKYRLNSKILYYIAEFYKNDKEVFFLGGGKGGLYRFKKELSNKKIPYYIGKKIYNQEIYDKLVKITNREDNDFFPKYREKII
jgi:hypothetical protein